MRQALVAGVFLIILLGVGNTVLHVLADQLVFAIVNGGASLVGPWAVLTIYRDRH